MDEKELLKKAFEYGNVPTSSPIASPNHVR